MIKFKAKITAKNLKKLHKELVEMTKDVAAGLSGRIDSRNQTYRTEFEVTYDT